MSGELRGRVVGREVDREGLDRARLEAEQLVVESRRVGGRAELDADTLVTSGARAVAVRLRAVRDRPARCRRARCRGLRPARSAPRDARSRSSASATASSSIAARRRAAARSSSRSPGSNARDRVERRGEGQRLACLDRDVADVRRVDRLDAALAQRVADRARNQIVRDVVQDLILEALLDDAGRRLARAEARALCAVRE